METVVAFNTELSGLYDSKPPISKAKMAAITRAAMKAIKFYKHVVQSVEKFILKCKPEYKIPGLYVIDSIVRQSRHQFGAEKDVFAPRFARNMKQTFANLFRCAPEDKSRIIRVLNLWQKNSVFAPEVIQPLFDLADPNHPIYQMSSVQDISNISNGINTSGQEGGTPNMDDSHNMSADLSAAIGHQTANTLDQSTIRQLQQLQQILLRQTNDSSAAGGTGANQSDSIKFNKKLLDYDYDDDEEEEKSTSPHVPNVLDGNNLSQLLKDPNVLRQLQTLQKLKQQEEKQSKLNEMRIQEEAFEKHLQNVLKGTVGNLGGVQSNTDAGEKEVEFIADDGKIEVINLDGNDSRSTSPDRDRYKRRRSSRSRSRDRGRERDRRRRSRSPRSRSRGGGSRSPKSNNRRRSSRDRDRNKEKERDKEKEKEREYERERRRKGLPDIKKEHLSVCSTTLWVGHLSKLVQQEELSDTFGKYGDIVSIDMIHPRGCAFIVMNRRQDAYKAMSSLKNHKMQGRAITISWAAGKGVKSKEWKDYWDLDLGVSYIPWNRLGHDTDLDSLEEGGMFDEDSMPDWIKAKLHQKKESKDKISGIGMFGMEAIQNVDTTQPPPPAGSMLAGVQMVPQFHVPRLMTPMGVPMPGNMVPGLALGPNMVPGMPPPHMMIPPGGMVTGFAPMPQMDKSIPPPNAGPSDTPTPIPNPFMQNMHMAAMSHQQTPFGNMGMPPQFQQPPNPQMSSGGNSNHQNDDHMDIEMEDEMPPNQITKPPPVNFSQPPPMFPGFNVNEMPSGMINDNRKNDRDDNRERREMEFREQNRGGRDRDRENNNNREREIHGEFNNRVDRDRSRWGSERSRSRDRDIQMPRDRERNRESIDREKINDSRADFNRRSGGGGGGGGLDQMGGNDMQPQIWRENNGPNFQPPNFNNNDRRGGGGGVNIQIDLQNPPPHHRPQQHDFFEMRRDNNDFGMDDRRGGQHDFFPNVGNRFGPQPGMGRGSPMPPMRGPGGPGGPPPPFGPRLGPMFIRGLARPGPPATGFNFNDRPPFERDDRGGGGGGGGRMRGGNNNMMDRRGGRGNWRDDEDGRRGGGGSRFQNRDISGGDRESRDDRKNRDRNDRDRSRDDRESRDRSDNRNRNERDRGDKRDRRSSPKREKESEISANKSSALQDTEEDWDQELSEHDFGDQKNDSNSQTSPKEHQSDEPPSYNTNEKHEQSNTIDIFDQMEPDDNESSFHRHHHQHHQEATSNDDKCDTDTFAKPKATETTQRVEKREESTTNYVNTTPLYDEPIDASSEQKTEQNKSHDERCSETPTVPEAITDSPVTETNSNETNAEE